MGKVLYVAEVGSLHKGNLALAHEFIRQFAKAGADIVKFQFGWSSLVEKELGIPSNSIRYVDQWAPELAEWCKFYGVELMASIWSSHGLRVAKSVDMKRYKIAHQLHHMTELIEEVLEDGKETYISSTEMYGEPVLSRKLIGTFASPVEYHPIYCQPQYPVYPTGQQRVKIPDFHRPKSWWYGYSDHSFGNGAALVAISHGAKYIEKHVALDKTDLSTRDSVFAVTPDEFRQLVEVGKEMEGVLYGA